MQGNNIIVGESYRLLSGLHPEINGEVKYYPRDSIVKVIGKAVNTEQQVTERLFLEFEDGLSRAFVYISHELIPL